MIEARRVIPFFPEERAVQQDEFDRAVLSRLPLAEAILSLWSWVSDDDHLADLYERHRGGCYEKKITFPLLT
jgi:hypothetical protein